MKRILFVDDEPNILSGLRRMLMRKRGEWDMHFAQGGEEALELLNNDPEFDVVVSDMRMPGMPGYQLLETVAKRWPGISRLILSGHAEHESALRAAGVAHQFLAKPCDQVGLERAVERTCAMRDHLSDRKIIAAMNGLGSLPALPESYRQLISELNNDEPCIEKISDILSQDISMATKILQLVNSSYFGLPRQVDSIRQAATLLGLDTVRSLALSTTVFAALKDASSTRRIEEIWRFGQIVAKVVGVMAEKLKVDEIAQSELRIAGFIHDIGRLALLQLSAEGYGKVEERIASGVSLEEAETEEFGVDHAKVGAFLLGIWGLPDGVVEAVFFHHCPFDENQYRLPHSWILGLAIELSNCALEERPIADSWKAVAVRQSANIDEWDDQIRSHVANQMEV